MNRLIERIFLLLEHLFSYLNDHAHMKLSEIDNQVCSSVGPVIQIGRDCKAIISCHVDELTNSTELGSHLGRRIPELP